MFAILGEGDTAGPDGRPPTRVRRHAFPGDWPLGRVHRVEAAVAGQGSGVGVREGLDLQAGCAPVLICWVSLSSSSTW